MNCCSDLASVSTSIHSLEGFTRPIRRGALVLSLLTLSAAVHAQGIPGAVAHWPFDDLANPTADVIGGYDGTIVGATFVGDVAPVPGNLYALEFDGVGGNVEIANDSALSFQASSSLSVGLWAQRTSDTGVVHILGKREGCGALGSGMNYQFGWTPNGGLEFASDGGILSTQLPLTLGQWTHLAATYDSTAPGTVRVYVNAVEVLVQSPYSLDGANASSLKIGASGACGGNFAGKIDEVWIFDRALSASEIKALSGGAVAHWPFDDLANPTADVIGGHDGTIVGATFVGDVAPVPGNLYALEFDGVGGNVEIANDSALSFQASSSLSVGLWAQRTSDTGVVHILGKREGCGALGSGMNYQFGWTPSGGVEFASDGGILSTQLPLTLGQWTHLAATYDSTAPGTVRVYVNAVEVLVQSPYTLVGANASSLKIGASGACGGSFAGKIDEVWIFDRALTSCEVGDLAGLAVGVETYCSPAAPNSFDPQGARLAAVGCASIAENDLTLSAQGVPPGALGVFFYGPTQVQVPFGNGTICIGGAVNRILPTVVADSSGSASLALDLSQPPFQGGGSGTVTPGSVWNFQLWYRDPAGVPSTFNFSDALEITFAP